MMTSKSRVMNIIQIVEINPTYQQFTIKVKFQLKMKIVIFLNPCMWLFTRDIPKIYKHAKAEYKDTKGVLN